METTLYLVINNEAYTHIPKQPLKLEKVPSAASYSTLNDSPVFKSTQPMVWKVLKYCVSLGEALNYRFYTYLSQKLSDLKKVLGALPY